MPPLVSPALLQSFEAACDEYGLPALVVLEVFTGNLSVETSLFAGGGLPYLASQAFKQCRKAVPPSLPLYPEKRKRGIAYLRQMLQVEWGYGTNEDKNIRNRALMDAWFHLNGLHNAVNCLALGSEIFLTLPRYYLLLCDLFLTPPQEPVSFFMEQVVRSSWRKDSTCPSLALVVFVADAVQAATENENRSYANV